MKDGKCPECGSDDVHSNIGLPTNQGNAIRIGIWSSPIPVDIYVCGNCRCVRTYVAGPYALKKIVEKWPRVNG